MNVSQVSAKYPCLSTHLLIIASPLSAPFQCSSHCRIHRPLEYVVMYVLLHYAAHVDVYKCKISVIHSFTF